jgi:hemerythrin superfamily protein
MFDFLCKDLVRHEKMEQKIWYPYLKEYVQLNTKIKHLLKEEKTAAKAIKEFKKIKTSEKWETKFIAFKKDVFHHAKEEETKLFPSVKKKLESNELKMIGKKLNTFKNKHVNHFL